MSVVTQPWTSEELERLAIGAGIQSGGTSRLARVVRQLHSELVGRTQDEAAAILEAWTTHLETHRGQRAAAAGRASVAYHRLSPSARQEIQLAGLTIAAFVREWYPDGQWGGDRCGCPDDRCRGHHHDVHEGCGCLVALIRDRVTR